MALQDIETSPGSGKYDDTGHNLTPDEKVKNAEDFFKKQKRALTGGPVGSHTIGNTSSGKIQATNSESKDELTIDTSGLSEADINRIKNVRTSW